MGTDVYSGRVSSQLKSNLEREARFRKTSVSGVLELAARALFERTDRWHQLCVNAFRQLRLPLLTSETVLPHLFHLVGESCDEMEAAWKFVRSGALVVASIEDAEMADIRTLMSRY